MSNTSMSHMEKFDILIKAMNIPGERMSATPKNAEWFLENGVRQNCDHPKILAAIFHARQIR